MKKIVLSVTLSAIAMAAVAQGGTKPAVKKPVAKTPVKTTAASTTTLKTKTDSASYAMGVSLASFYKQQGVKNINSAMVSKAIQDVMGGKKILLDDQATNNILNKLIFAVQEEKAQVVIDSGRAFLARNKKRAGVKETASGLQYEVITEGTGVKPTAQSTFVAHYRGTLIDGTEFDASYNRGQPLEMPLANVIKGWVEGMQLMPVGSKYKFYMPYELGYGLHGSGQIPGGAALIFEIELLGVK